MEKLKMGIRVFVLMLLMQVHVFATQVYEESENITDTESVVGQDLTEKNETNKTGQAAFNIHINVPDGFMDEIQLLFISQETEDEFECVLTQENQYAMSFLLNGSQTYDLMYYYKSYKEYEIAEIPDYYECGTESLWVEKMILEDKLKRHVDDLISRYPKLKEGLLIKKGKIIEKIPQDQIVARLKEEIDKF